MHRLPHSPPAIRLMLCLALLFMCFPVLAHSADVTLAWDPPNDKRVTGYIVYYGKIGTAYEDASRKTIGSPKQTSAVISGLQAGETYGFVMTSFDSAKNESVFSEAITYTVPLQTEVAAAADSSGDSPADPEKTTNVSGEENIGGHSAGEGNSLP